MHRTNGLSAYWTNTDLLNYLDAPVLDWTMGSKSLPSAPVCSHSPDGRYSNQLLGPPGPL